MYGALYIIVCMCGVGRRDMCECGLKVISSYLFKSSY